MHNESKVGKFIVFKIMDYLLALPIEEVLKVVNCSPVASSSIRTMGVVQLGRHMIRVLDLHQRFSISNLPQLPANQLFLVITRGSGEELCGIPVDEPPNLVELPLDIMRRLPKSQLESNRLLELVSHAAVLAQENVTTTIFLLDTTFRTSVSKVDKYGSDNS
jgi:purine-binding chemotaxis protein CheW